MATVNTSGGFPGRPPSRGRPFGDVRNRSNVANGNGNGNDTDGGGMVGPGKQPSKTMAYARDTASSRRASSVTKRRTGSAGDGCGKENCGDGNGKGVIGGSGSGISSSANAPRSASAPRAGAGGGVRTGSTPSNFQSLRDAFQKRSQTATQAGIAHAQHSSSGRSSSGGSVSLSDGFSQQQKQQQKQQQAPRPPSRGKGRVPSSSAAASASASTSSSTTSNRQPVEVYDESTEVRSPSPSDEEVREQPQPSAPASLTSPKVTVSKSQLDRMVNDKVTQRVESAVKKTQRSSMASAYEAHVRLKSAEHTIGSLKKEMDEIRYFRDVEVNSNAECRDDRAVQTDESEKENNTVDAVVNTNSTPQPSGKVVKNRGTFMSPERAGSDTTPTAAAASANAAKKDAEREAFDQASQEAHRLRRENNSLKSEISSLRATVEMANMASEQSAAAAAEQQDATKEVQRLRTELESTRNELQETRGAAQSNELFAKLRTKLEVQAEELQGQLDEERRARGELERELVAEKAAAAAAASDGNTEEDNGRGDESLQEDLSAAMAELVEKEEEIKTLRAKLRKKEEQTAEARRVVPFNAGNKGSSASSADYDELVKKEKEIQSLRETLNEWAMHHRDCDVKAELLAEQEEKLRDASAEIKTANARVEELEWTLDEAKNTMMLVQNENTRHLEKSIKTRDVNSMQNWAKWKKQEARLRAENDKRTKQLEETMRIVTELETKLAESEGKVATGNDTIKALREEVEATSKDLEATEQDAEVLAGKVDRANAEVTMHRATISDLEKKLGEQAERANEFKSKFKNAAKSLETANAEAEEHSATTAKILSEKDSAIETLTKALTDTKDQNEEMFAGLEKSSEQIKRLKDEVDEGDAEIRALQMELEQTSTAANKTRADLNKRNSLLSYMEKELNGTKAKREEQAKTLEQNIEQIEKLRAMELERTAEVHLLKEKLAKRETSMMMQLEDAAEHLAKKEYVISNLTNENTEAKAQKQVLYESLQQSSDRIKELQEASRDKAAAFEAEKKAIQDVVTEKEKVIDTLKEEVSVSEMQKQAMETNLQQGTYQIKELQDKTREQAADIAEMKTSKKKLEDALTTLEAAASASKVRVRELECECEQLKEACVNFEENQSTLKEATKRHEALEGTIKKLEAELQSTRKISQSHEATIARLREQVEEQEEQMQEHCDRIKNSAKEMQTVLEDANNRQHSLEGALTELDSELQDSLKLNEEHEGTISKMEGLFQEYENKLKAANDATEGQKKSFDNQLLLLKKVNGDMESIHESLRKELETKEGDLATMTEKVQELENTISGLNDQLCQKQDVLERANSESANAARLAKSEIEALEHLADELRMDLVSCQNELNAATREKEELGVVVTETKAHLERANAELSGNESKVAVLQDGLDEARKALAEVTSRREIKEAELVATAQQAKARAETHESENISLKNQIEEKVVMVQKLEIERDVYKNGVDRASGERGSLQADYKALEETVGMYRETLESLEEVSKERIKSLEEQLLDAERTHADAERELNDALSAKASVEKEAECTKEAMAREIDGLKAKIAKVQEEAEQAKQQAAKRAASATPQKIVPRLSTCDEDLNSSIDGHATPKKEVDDESKKKEEARDEEMQNMRVCLEFLKERVGTSNKRNAALEKSNASLRLKCISLENTMRDMQRSAPVPEEAESMRSPDCVGSSEVGVSDREKIETAALAKYMHNRQKKMAPPT